MALAGVVKSGGRTPPVKKPPVKRASIPAIEVSSAGNLDIPDVPSEPEYDLAKAATYIHGEAGIGKTTFVNEWDTPLFLSFEAGGKYLQIFRLPLKGNFGKWEEFVKVVDNLQKTEKRRTVVFDTVDLAYELCTDYIVTQAGEDHINEGNLGYGKGLDRVDAEFKKQINRITATGRGVVFISHTKSQEFEKPTGAKFHKLTASTRDRGRRFISGFVDIIGYYGYYGEDRYLTIKGSDSVEAKNRIKGRFLTTKKQQIHSIPMGDSAEEAYANFVNAFNNKQTDPHILSRKAALSETKAGFGKRR